MSDPQRLLSDASSDPMGRLLLESWQEDGPPTDGRARTLAALGIASTATVAGASLGSIAPKALASFSFVKWVGLAAILGVATVSGAIYLSHSSSNTKVQVPLVIQSPATTSIPKESPTSSSITLETTDSTPARTSPLPRRIAKPNESVHTSDRLSEEIATIDAARRALTSGDDDHAGTLAAEYETRFPRGTFSEEAEAIRITALSQNGDAAKARILGAAFLQAHPSSPYAPRIRLLVDGPNH